VLVIFSLVFILWLGVCLVILHKVCSSNSTAAVGLVWSTLLVFLEEVAKICSSFKRSAFLTDYMTSQLHGFEVQPVPLIFDCLQYAKTEGEIA